MKIPPLFPPAWDWHRWQRTKHPILVGPWLSELGFEILYWLPWLAKWRQTWKIPSERLIAVSRGGAGLWYEMGQAVELYDYVSPAVLRRRQIAASMAQQSVKQLTVTQWETELIEFIAKDLGLRRYHLLHPSAMYQLLGPWWTGQMGEEEVFRHLLFAPPPVGLPPPTIPLPPKFVAVKFYGRATWSGKPELIDWSANLVSALAKQIPIVLLTSGVSADEHEDTLLPGDHLTLAPFVRPQTNLAAQAAVIAKAQAFVGTYGGTMQLAVRLRRPAFGVYDQFRGTAYAHKVLTHWLAMQHGQPAFIGTPTEAGFVAELLKT